MRQVVLLACKDLRLLARDRVAAFFTLAFPIIFGVAFGFIFRGAMTGQAETSAVGFVDRDRSELSGALERALADRGLDLTDVPGEPGEAVRAGNLAAVVVLEDGFADRADDIFEGGALGATLVTDPSKGPEIAMVEGHLTAALFEVVTIAMRDADRLERLARSDEVPAPARAQLAAASAAMRSGIDADGDGAAPGGFAPVRIERMDAARGNVGVGGMNAFELTFPQSAAWALVGCVTGFGISLAHERSRGTLGRVLAGPVRASTVLAGKALACFVCALGVLTAIRLLFALPVFGVRGGSLWLEGIVLAACAFGFTGVMMTLAAVARGERGAEGLVRATLLLLALLGGAGVPLVFFTGWMRKVTAASPFRWAIEAIEGATWRGWSALELAVPVGVLVAVGVCGLFVGSLLFTRRAG